MRSLAWQHTTYMPVIRDTHACKLLDTTTALGIRTRNLRRLLRRAAASLHARFGRGSCALCQLTSQSLLCCCLCRSSDGT